MLSDNGEIKHNNQSALGQEQDDNNEVNNNKPKVTRNKRRHKKLSKTQQRIVWRRNKLSEYLVKGVSVQEASNLLNIPYKTLWDDMSVLKEEAKENMRNHVIELPWHIKQACDGLNQVIKILYEIQDLDNAITRRTSDNVRVLALSQIREAIKLKLEVLTSQGAVEDALQFIESTKQLRIVKDKFNQDMKEVREQDQNESLPIMDALTNENVNNGNNMMVVELDGLEDKGQSNERISENELEEEENKIASHYTEPITQETISQHEHDYYKQTDNSNSNNNIDTDIDQDTIRRINQQREQYQYQQQKSKNNSNV